MEILGESGSSIYPDYEFRIYSFARVIASQKAVFLFLSLGITIKSSLKLIMPRLRLNLFQIKNIQGG